MCSIHVALVTVQNVGIGVVLQIHQSLFYRSYPFPEWTGCKKALLACEK